jgi:hypothetical protein
MTTTLLDAVDTRNRRLQNLLMWAGIALLIGSLMFFKAPGAGKTSPGGWLTMASGFGAFALAFVTRVRWQVAYKAHTIVFENDPFRGERLVIDGAIAAKGKLGINNTLTASLPEGDRIVATTVAALASFRCRIVAEPAADAATSASRGTAAAIAFE